VSFRPNSGGGHYNDSTVIYDNGNKLTIKKIPVAVSASGTLVAAVVGCQIRVIAFALTSSGTVNVKFQSHTTGDLTGLFYEIANTGFVLSPNTWGWFETVVGEALDISLSAGIPVGGVLTYVEVIP
jgi:glycine cleavage system protein P-like pyridoxal-binding family